MAKKIRLTQEEEVIRLLHREGFKEISKEDLLQEPYKSFIKVPDCFERKLSAKSGMRKSLAERT